MWRVEGRDAPQKMRELKILCNFYLLDFTYVEIGTERAERLKCFWRCFFMTGIGGYFEVLYALYDLPYCNRIPVLSILRYPFEGASERE